MRADLVGRACAAKGFMPPDEGLALYRAGLTAAKDAAGPLLEVGTYCAKSAIYLGAAAQLTGRVVYSIDHHRGSEELQPGWEHHDPSLVGPDGRIDTLSEARSNVAAAGLEDAVILVVGRSATVAHDWATSLALVFIDGGHSGAEAWSDYRCWSPLVSPGGVLAIHDVFADPADGGRPPYELYCDAVESGRFGDLASAGCGSLRVLQRVT